MRRIALLLIAASLALAAGLAPPGIATAAAAAGDELLPNPSLELEDVLAGEPVDWSPSGWADPGGWAPTFTYVKNDGHSGLHSVKVEIANYAPSGDGKWMVDLGLDSQQQPIEGVPVEGGQYYTFSDWYKSNVSTAVSVFYKTAADGPYEGNWANLFTGIPPAGEWTQYTTGFTMPVDAVRAYFVHFIARNGYLQTDDYSLRKTAAPPGFDHPMVSLTFDDGSAAFYRDALPLLSTRGFKTTQYIPTELLDEDDWMMTDEQVGELARQGHEIGGHSITHPDLTTLSDGELRTELADNLARLRRIDGVGTVRSFAYPYGAYDARVIDALKANGWQSGRSVEEGYNGRLDLERYDIRVQNMTRDTTLAQFRSWVDYAKAHNYWLVVVYHEVMPDDTPRCGDPGADPDACLDLYHTTLGQFDQQLDAIVNAGLSDNVVTVGAALDLVTNDRPTGSATITPTAPTTRDLLTASHTFTDPDHDALTYRYQWFNGDTAIAGATGKTLDLSAPGHGDRGDLIRVEVTADDGAGGIITAVSEAVTVANSAPVRGSVALTPAAPAAGTALIATPNGFADADGDGLNYRYAWYRDGQRIAGQTGSTLPGAAVLAGAAIRVDVTAVDGHGGASTAATAAVTVAGAGADPSPTPEPEVPSPTPTAALSVDRLGPRIRVATPRARAYKVGRKLKIRFSCTDASGVATRRATVHRRGGTARRVRNGATLRLKRPGRYVLRITAKDRLGNTASTRVHFRVTRR